MAKEKKEKKKLTAKDNPKVKSVPKRELTPKQKKFLGIGVKEKKVKKK